MGATLGKGKNFSTSGKVNGHKKELITKSDNHLDGTTTLEKKIKKKKANLSNRKSLDIKVDKFTSTDVNAISSSSTSAAYIKQLVNGSGSNHHLYDAQMNSSNYSGTPSKDVLELRDACIRRGIISPEMNIITLPTPIEQTPDESTPAIVVTNNEEVHNEEVHNEEVQNEEVHNEEVQNES